MKNIFLWPSLEPIKKNSPLKGDPKSLIESLEGRIIALFPGCFCVLFPSARSAIYTILESNNIKRSDHVLISEFNSHCVIESVSRLATPTIKPTDQTNVVIINHQWGYPKKISTATKSKFSKLILIEDSCDSWILNRNAFFPNNGDYEIFSLPKIIGSTFGGLVICKSSSTALKLKALRDSRETKLGNIQFLLKNKSLQDKSKNSLYYNFWEGAEALNGKLPLAAVQQIADYLDNIPQIEKQKLIRIKKISELKLPLLVEVNTVLKRLPVVIPVQLTDKQQRNLTEAGLVPYFRYFNTANWMDNPTFKLCFPLPIHQGIDEESFEKMLFVLSDK